MEKVENLQKKAEILRVLLVQYAKSDGNAERVLNFMIPFFQAVEKGEIIPPYEHQYRRYFENTESPLYRKYENLTRAASEYSCALEDWESQDWYKQLKDRNK